MTRKELRNLGITKTIIDNGYRVPKTHRFTSVYSDKIIDIDPYDDYGSKCYCISINDDILEFNNKVLKWETRGQAEEDVVELFNGKLPRNSYRTVY